MPSTNTTRKPAKPAKIQSFSRSTATQHDIAKYISLSLPKEISNYLEIRNVPNKGRGVYLAKGWKFVAPGTILLRESPLLAVENDPETPREILQQRMENVYSRMREDNRMKLAHVYWGERENEGENSTQYENNLLNRQKFCAWCPEGWSYIYYGLSFINHSCQPNVMIDCDANGNANLVAVYPIREDEEVLVSYIDFDMLLGTYAKRQKRFNEYWNFHCKCVICEQHTNNQKDDLEQLKRLRAGKLVKRFHVDRFAPVVELDLRDDGQQTMAQLEIDELVQLLCDTRMFHLIGNSYVQAIFIWACCRDQNLRKSKVMQYMWRLKSQWNQFKALHSQQDFYSEDCGVFIVAETYAEALVACNFHKSVVKIKVPASYYREWIELKPRNNEFIQRVNRFSIMDANTYSTTSQRDESLDAIEQQTANRNAQEDHLMATPESKNVGGGSINTVRSVTATNSQMRQQRNVPSGSVGGHAQKRQMEETESMLRTTRSRTETSRISSANKGNTEPAAFNDHGETQPSRERLVRSTKMPRRYQD